MPNPKPRLRPDLKITRHMQQDGVHYVIKDPTTGEYYRFPEEEYNAFRFFDGTHLVTEIPALFSAAYPELEIDVDTVQQFFSSLDKIHLIEKPLAEQNLFLLERLREQRKRSLLGAKGNLMSMRFTLFDPDRMLNRIYPSIKWVFSIPFLVGAGLFVLTALFLVFQEYDRMAEGLKSITTFSNQTPLALAGLWITVVVIILFHELGHAFTCKHFGGEVHELGILLMFFMPCFYANVNDAWTFEKRYQKLAVTFAGGLVEFFIGSIAAYFWFFLNPASPFSAICYQTMTVCAASTVLFNFNPLMKLDGYYAFSDFTGIPNLRAESGKFAALFFQKHLFRMKVDDPFEGYTRRGKRILLIYGAASSLYMVSVMAGLFAMVQNLLIGSLSTLGVILSFWFGWTIFKGYGMKFKSLSSKFIKQKGHLFFAHRYLFSALGIIMVGIVLYGFSLQPMKISRACTLVPLHTTKIFAGVPGTVLTGPLLPGTPVAQGDTLTMLVNYDKGDELKQLTGKLEMQKIDYANAMHDNNVQALQSGRFELIRIAREVEVLRKELSSGMVVTSPVNGVVLTSQLAKGFKPWFNRGSELCEIAQLDTFYISLTVLESEIGALHKGDKATIRLFSSLLSPINGTITSIAPVSKNYGDKQKQNEKSKGVENEFAISVKATNTPAMTLKPNMSGHIQISSGTVRGFLLLWLKVRSALRADLFF